MRERCMNTACSQYPRNCHSNTWYPTPNISRESMCTETLHDPTIKAGMSNNHKCQPSRLVREL